ncbi:MAG: hypothetical protein WA532_13325 [Candidatus Korobacteraceae bacterium]
MSTNGTTFQNNLIDRIVKFATDPSRTGSCTASDLVAAIPELTKLSNLLGAVESAHNDCLMALAGTWDRSDDGFEATRDVLALTYVSLTGIELPEQEDPEEEGENGKEFQQTT